MLYHEALEPLFKKFPNYRFDVLIGYGNTVRISMYDVNALLGWDGHVSAAEIPNSLEELDMNYLMGFFGKTASEYEALKPTLMPLPFDD
jgi:hypothetical protein